MNNLFDTKIYVINKAIGTKACVLSWTENYIEGYSIMG